MSALTDGCIRFAERLACEGHEYLTDAIASAGRSTLDQEETSLAIDSVSLWRESAYPVVELSEKLAASLVLTRLPSGFPDLRWPWRAFMVVVPDWVDDGTLTVADGPLVEAVLIVGLSGGDFGLMAVGHGYNARTSSRQVILGEPLHYGSVQKFCEVTEASTSRSSKAIGRIVIGALCELNGVPPKRPRTSSFVKHEERGMPSAWWFQVTRPVIVDFRETARQYISGHGGKVFLQRLVRGHWQHYWVGKKDGERKVVLKHKEPFWQGNPNAPIALRQHVLGRSQ